MMSALILAWATAQVLTVDAAEFDLSPGRPEYCRKKDGTEVDLLSVALLKSERLDLQPYGIAAVLALDGDWIDLQAAAAGKVRPYQQDMGYAAIPGENLDVDLSITLYQGRPMLHWKETYKHRAARLGLFSIKSDGKLEPLCVGGPTVVSLH